MKSKKLLATILFLFGVIACVVAFQRFIVYSDASDSARNFGYDADRATGQKRMDMSREADRRNNLTKTPAIEAAFSGLIGVGLIITSIVLIVGRKAKDSIEINEPND